MKKIYESIQIEVIVLLEDVIRTSQNDNVSNLPEFPETFG